VNIRRFLRKRTITWIGLAAATALVLAACTPFPPPSQPPKVILYGDSLSVESWDTFKLVIENHGVAVAENRTMGGTAICDWFDEMEADKEAILPSAVVLEFVGNTQPACMNGLTGQAALEKYGADLQHAIDIWKPRGVKVFVAAPPPKVLGGGTSEAQNPYRDMYFLSAVSNGQGFVDAGHAAVWNPITGLYQFHMPCLPDEGADLGCNNGLIQVRDGRDGLHFCPSGSRPLPCTNEYVSGSRRFGFEMAAPIITEKGW
jgi:hypothetical protein